MGPTKRPQCPQQRLMVWQDGNTATASGRSIQMSSPFLKPLLAKTPFPRLASLHATSTSAWFKSPSAMCLATSRPKGVNEAAISFPTNWFGPSIVSKLITIQNGQSILFGEAQRINFSSFFFSRSLSDLFHHHMSLVCFLVSFVPLAIQIFPLTFVSSFLFSLIVFL